MTHLKSRLREQKRHINSEILRIKFYLDGGMSEIQLDGSPVVLAMSDDRKPWAEKTIAQLKAKRDELQERIAQEL